MGLVNTVVPLEQLEEETVRWCREMLALSPFALRLLKASFNASEDGLRRPAAARARRQPPLLHVRGGAGGPRRLPREAHARLLEVSPPAVAEWPGTPFRCASGRWPPGRARCRPRSRRCSSARRWPAARTTFRPLAFCAALIGSVFIQIGTNLSNDYSDARRGADTEERLGPVRVTAGGLVPPRKVLVATWLAFGIAVAAGAYLIALVGLGAAGDRRRLDPGRASSTRAARAPTDTRAWARSSCSRSSAWSPWSARTTCRPRS